MFGDYSVATASRHPSSLPCHEDSFDAAPFDSRVLAQKTFARQLSITQLTQRFSEQRLQHDAPLSIRSDPYSSSTESSSDVDYADLPSPRSYVGVLSPSRRRSRRQEGVRMLCDPAHLRSIQEMVERMVQSEDQCAVSPSQRLSFGETPLPNCEDDEGYNSLEEASTRSNSSSSSSCGLVYRRSADMSLTSACVSKNVRQRKTRNRKSLPTKA